MFNKKPINNMYRVSILLFLVVFFSCNDDVTLTFSEQAITSVKGADISVIYPEVEGNSEIAANINRVIENHIVNALSFSEEPLKDVHLADAVMKFNEEYAQFKTDFPDSEQQWNAAIEGEVVYHSSEIITIAMNSYLDTGGAHGNDNITFLNFDSKSGDVFKNEDILKLNDKFIKVSKAYFEKEIVSDDGSIEDYFFGEPFHLPANIGFSEEGVIFLYNVYEIASYAQGYSEFVIPFEELGAFLKVQ